MYKRFFYPSALSLLLVFSDGFIPLNINLGPPLTSGAKRLTFSLYAEEILYSQTWKNELAEISSKSILAMSLPTKEIQSLIERCDNLKPIINSLEETPRKINLLRLNKTRALFVFVIESRNKDSK